ncbi:MAG: HNH endonuclease [Planctomycetota bacterium]
MMPVAPQDKPGDKALLDCLADYRGRLTTQPVKQVWKNFRQAKCGKGWFAALLAAYGKRCVYCDHCPAWTIEHVSPKTSEGDDPFEWSNWLPACGDCNRGKSTLELLDPLEVDPRAFLQFDLLTGEPLLIDQADGHPHARAKRMVENLGLKNQVFKDARRAKLRQAALKLRELMDAANATDLAEFAKELQRAEPHRAILRELFLEDDALLNPHAALARKAKEAHPELVEWATRPLESALAA